jgi:epoxyqueuosine reductase
VQDTPDIDFSVLLLAIKAWGRELGFAEVRIADTDLTQAEAGLQAWLAAGHHGEMDYMAAHGTKRARPAELVPGTVRVISARMDYLPAGDAAACAPAADADRAADLDATADGDAAAADAAAPTGARANGRASTIRKPLRFRSMGAAATTTR